MGVSLPPDLSELSQEMNGLALTPTHTRTQLKPSEMYQNLPSYRSSFSLHSLKSDVSILSSRDPTSKQVTLELDRPDTTRLDSTTARKNTRRSVSKSSNIAVLPWLDSLDCGPKHLHLESV